MSDNVSSLFPSAKASPPHQAYARKVEAMSDDDFFAECKRVMLLAAYAAEDSQSDFHWQHMVCVAQSKLRGRPDLYDKALSDQTASSGTRGGKAGVL